MKTRVTAAFFVASFVLSTVLVTVARSSPAAADDGYEPGRIRAEKLAERVIRTMEPAALPDGTIATPQHKLVRVRVNLGDVMLERDRVLSEAAESLDEIESNLGRAARLDAETALTQPYDDVLTGAGGGVSAAGVSQWTGECWVPVISRVYGLNLSRASWDAPCGEEKDPITAQYWLGISTAKQRTQLSGWVSTGGCVFNPVQYLWVDTDSQYGWYASTESMAHATSFPYNPPCGNRDHIRMWQTSDSTFGAITWATPHREYWQTNPIGHHVTSWTQGQTRLYNDYDGFGFGNNATYYCGWVWAGTYGSGGYIGCGIELTWSP